MRYDPIAGWIADQAFLEFYDANTNDFLYAIKTDARAITPIVKTLIQKLTNSVIEFNR